MSETARAHERLEPVVVPQAQRLAEGPLPEDVMVFPSNPAPGYGLLIHFHGAPYIPYLAMRAGQPPMTVVAVNLGSGSSAYERPFLDPGAFPALVDSALARAGTDNRPERIFLSGFSAGYGAIRSILREHAERVDGVLLLDGLHASYVPEGRVLSAGGRVDSTDMAPFVAFARRAARREKVFLFTHSEIFPGTYVSTTEAADFLLAELGLERTPVLDWGPVGMQQVSRAGSGAFDVLGFAGNSAPDHVDHLHGMPEFLALLLEDGRR